MGLPGRLAAAGSGTSKQATSTTTINKLQRILYVILF
jgi:hypothetical protein